MASSGVLGGKLALVTGAASGIGKSVCELFAKQGAVVIAAGLQDVHIVAANLHCTSNEVKHSAFPLDVTSNQQIENVMAEVLKQYKCPPTIAVNCAGIIKDNFLVKMNEKDFEDVINVNLKGTFLVTKHLTNQLIANNIKGASIINISSIVGKTGNIGQVNYAASKAGVVGLTKTSAMELARYNIRCNAVLPGFIKTEMTDWVPDQVKQKIVDKLVPLRRMGEPEDIAEACLFLASDKSRYMTGASLEVTGGLGM